MISEPENYGLSPRQTLVHTADTERPADFAPFWQEFREECLALPDRWRGRIDDRVNEVVIPSVRAVEVIGRVAMPEQDTVRGVIVTTHGYSPEASWPGLPEPGDEHGLVTLRLRVRGFPPSTIDMADLRGGWILHHIESPQTWILRGAIGDVVAAVRCVRGHFGGDLPVMLHGESFGGGLAVIAAAQLQQMGVTIPRMAIGLPTFGDWRWRDERYCHGAGGLINQWLETLREERERYVDRLRLFDAALHAADCPAEVLCKLATMDDVVPAPTAAAIYNALPDPKYRYVVKYGHFDGGLGDLRRHAMFERIWPAFLDPTRQPADVLATIESELAA